MGTLAVRLEVPVIKVSKGLSPSSHFPVGFRLAVASASHWRYAPCLAHVRGRDGRYRPPPAQIPASGTPALGSYFECLAANRS